MNWRDGNVAAENRAHERWGHEGRTPAGRTPGGQTPGGDVGSLVIGAADGDDWAWDELVSRLSPLVSSATAAHQLNEADSARVSATVWRRLGRNLGKIRQPDRVGTWLGVVARDECVKAMSTVGSSAA